VVFDSWGVIYPGYASHFLDRGHIFYTVRHNLCPESPPSVARLTFHYALGLVSNLSSEFREYAVLARMHEYDFGVVRVVSSSISCDWILFVTANASFIH